MHTLITKINPLTVLNTEYSINTKHELYTSSVSSYYQEDIGGPKLQREVHAL